MLQSIYKDVIYCQPPGYQKVIRCKRYLDLWRNWSSTMIRNINGLTRSGQCERPTKHVRCSSVNSQVRAQSRTGGACSKGKGKVKVTSYVALYPDLRIAQSALHFTSLTDLFNQTHSQLLWEASCHMLQLICEGCLYTYPPPSIARYPSIQLSELEQCRVKKLAQGFNTAAQVSNPGSRSQGFEALPLSHCALLFSMMN